MNQCKHPRVQVVSRDEDTEYVECLDCQEIFEAEDLEPVKVDEEEE